MILLYLSDIYKGNKVRNKNVFINKFFQINHSINFYINLLILLLILIDINYIYIFSNKYK